MARINIEEKYWNDPRRTLLLSLINDPFRMDGVFLNLVRIAQTYARDGEPMPEKTFMMLPYAQHFLTVGLCEVVEGGIRLDGSTRHFGWLAGRVAGARKGGAKTSDAKREAALLREKRKRENIEESGHKLNAQKSTKSTESTKPQASPSPSPSEEIKEGGSAPTLTPNLPNQIAEVWRVWNETLECFDVAAVNISPHEQSQIAMYIRKFTFENVLLTVEGKRYEKGFKDYDPAESLSMSKLFGMDNKGNYRWETHKNRALSDRNKNAPKKMSDEEIDAQAMGRKNA